MCLPCLPFLLIMSFTLGCDGYGRIGGMEQTLCCIEGILCGPPRIAVIVTFR